MSESIFESTKKAVEANGLNIISSDLSRPWGGFYVLDDAQITQFIEAYFKDFGLPAELAGLSLSPKILMVAPQKRLSWQYHHRRGEIWSVLTGPVGVAHGKSDDQPEPDVLQQGQTINLDPGTRHRLIGLDKWGVVAEIWVHNDPKQPSDENDIVRVQDDFGRSNG